jgi:hypothetical protein
MKNNYRRPTNMSATPNDAANDETIRPSRNAHPDSTAVAQRTRCPSISVYALGDLDAYYTVPSDRITHAPEHLLRIESLVLCPAFDPAIPTLTECPLGVACRHVHADVTGLPLIEVHVNYAWRSLEDVTYPRHGAGSTVQVAPPNSLQAIDMIETGCLLQTRALSAARRPLSHCAHYYFNRQCNLGGECRFVHAVFIDPSTDTLRRAPAPIQLGRYTPSARDLARHTACRRSSTPSSDCGMRAGDDVDTCRDACAGSNPHRATPSFVLPSPHLPSVGSSSANLLGASTRSDWSLTPPAAIDRSTGRRHHASRVFN